MRRRREESADLSSALAGKDESSGRWQQRSGSHRPVDGMGGTRESPSGFEAVEEPLP